MHEEDMVILFENTPFEIEAIRHNKSEVKYYKDLLAEQLNKMLELELEELAQEIQEINSTKDGNAQSDIIINLQPAEIREMVEKVYTMHMTKYDCEKIQSLILPSDE
jgi:hypothetical protein